MAWKPQSEPVPVTSFAGKLPAPGSIAIFRGRLKLLVLPEDMHPKAAITVLPRPNQAFWTLSAVWSGWLWGREAVNPLRSAVERRRYDWLWHTNAVHQAFSALTRLGKQPLSFFCLVPEVVGYHREREWSERASLHFPRPEDLGCLLDWRQQRPRDEELILRWRVRERGLDGRHQG